MSHPCAVGLPHFSSSSRGPPDRSGAPAPDARGSRGWSAAPSCRSPSRPPTSTATATPAWTSTRAAATPRPTPTAPPGPPTTSRPSTRRRPLRPRSPPAARPPPPSLSTFWFTTGGLAHADSGSGLSDPVVTYNDQIGRFIVGDQDVNFNTHVSRFDIAVSKTSNPASLSARRLELLPDQHDRRPATTPTTPATSATTTTPSSSR